MRRTHQPVLVRHVELHRVAHRQDPRATDERVNVWTENIENNRSDTVNQLDLRIDKTFTLTSPWGGDTHRFTVMMNIMNALNSNPVTNFNMSVGSSFNNVIEYLSARAFKLGIRYQF